MRTEGADGEKADYGSEDIGGTDNSDTPCDEELDGC